MATSIEALYIILGLLDTERRQDPLSFNRYFESVCLYKGTQLGIDINTGKMIVSLSDKKEDQC